MVEHGAGRRDDEEAVRRRWLVLVGCLVCQMGLGLGGYVIAAFLVPIVEELGWSRAAFAGSTLPLLLAMSLASPLVGRCTERVGARAVFLVSITIVALALLGLSRMTSIGQFYVLSFVLGVGVTGLGDIPAGGVVTAWFREHRGLALGLTYLGSNIGGGLVPFVAGTVTEMATWRVALVVLAAGGWLLIFPTALLLVRDRNRPPRSGGAVEVALTGEPLGEAVRTRDFWILAFVLFAFYFYYLGVNNHLVAYLADAGASYSVAARRFGYAVLIGVVGKIGIGLYADRVAIRAALLVTFGLLTAGSWLLLALPARPDLQLAFLTVHGVTVAAENVMLPLVVAARFGPRHLPAIYGVLMLALLPGGALGPVLAGWVQDTTGTYGPAFLAFAVGNTVALGLLSLVRTRVRGGVEREQAGTAS